MNDSCRIYQRLIVASGGENGRTRSKISEMNNTLRMDFAYAGERGAGGAIMTENKGRRKRANEQRTKQTKETKETKR